MGWIIPAISVDCGFKFAVMLILFIRYLETKDRVIFWWAIGWGFFGIHAAIELILIGTKYEPFWFIRHIVYAFTAVAFLESVGYMKHPVEKLWHIVSITVGIVAVISSYIGVFVVRDWHTAALAASFINGLGFIICALYFLKFTKEKKGIIKLLIFLGFLLNGIHNLDYPFLRPVAWFAPIGFSLGVIFSVIFAIGLIMVTTAELSRQKKESQRTSHNLYVLNSIAETVSRTLNLEEILNDVLEKVLKTIDIEAGCIFLFNESDTPKGTGQELVLSVYRGLSEEYIPKISRLKLDDKNPCCREVLKRKVVVLADGESQNLNVISTNNEILNCSVCILLKSKENIRGILRLFSHSGRIFSDQDIRLLTSIGNTIGVAIDNAQLYATIERWGKKLALEVEKKARELQETQEKLICSEKLAAIGQLASGVGHELRSPLGVLKNCAYYLKNIIKTENPEVIKYLNIIDKEVNISIKIINDLLEFARVSKAILKPVNCNIIIDEILLDTEVPENIIIKKDLNQNLSKVMADSDQLYQVFVNIILNAYQSMPNGGELIIRAREKEEFVEIIFKDNGCGIPKENLDKIFDPLFSTKAKGVGLGLTICRSVIESHQGEIYIESELDKGTIFTIKLPLASETEGAIK